LKPHYENVVIGSDLRSVIFAYVNKYPLFFTAPRRPSRFDYFCPTVELEHMSIPPISQILKTPDGFKEVGIPKNLLWERLVFLLSLRGDLPLSNMCDKIRYNGEKIVCTNEYSKIHEFGFDTCHYFGDSYTFGLVDFVEKPQPSYLCYDYIAFHKGGKHEIDYISTGDDFVGEIWFYSSDRIDGNTGVKDACVVSSLTPEQFGDPDFSETIARFKMEKILDDHGIRGPLNGYTPNGRPKHYRIKTSHIRRERYNLNSPKWRETWNVKRNSQSLEDLLEELKQAGLRNFEGLRCDYTLPA